MNGTLEQSGTLSPMDLGMARSKGIVISFWTVTALFCLQMGVLWALSYIFWRRLQAIPASA